MPVFARQTSVFGVDSRIMLRGRALSERIRRSDISASFYIVAIYIPVTRQRSKQFSFSSRTFPTVVDDGRDRRSPIHGVEYFQKSLFALVYGRTCLNGEE